DHLILIELLEAHGILAGAAVLGAARRLDVGAVPGLGSERAQEGRGIERAGADLARIGLRDDAAALGPVALEPEDEILERRHAGAHRGASNERSNSSERKPAKRWKCVCR